MTLNTTTAEVSGQLPTTWVKAGEYTFSSYSWANATILNTSTYDAFGVLIKTGADTLLYYYRQAASHFGADGILRRMEYTISTATWGSPTTVYTHATEGVSGVAGGIINGNIMLFFSLTDSSGNMQSIGSILSTDGLTGSTFDSRVTFTPGDLRYEAYGHLKNCDGQVYVQPFFSHDGAGTYKSNIRRTTDNGATWTTINIQTSSTPKPSETDIEYLGSGRLIAISRNQANGYLLQATSSDYGLTWTAFSATNMGNLSGISNASVEYDSSTDRLYICWADRTAAKIMLGFANVTDVFTAPTKWICQTVGATTTSGNPIGGALGYPSMQLVAAGDLYIVWNNEASASDADNRGGRWLLISAAADATVAAQFPKGGTGAFGFLQQTAGNTPTLKSAAVAGDSALLFTSASSQNLVASQLLTATAGTIFILGKTGTLADFQSLFSSMDEAASGNGISLRSNGNSTNQCMEIVDGPSSRVRGSTTITANTEYCWVFASSGAASGYDLRLGTTQQTETVRIGSHTGNWFGDYSQSDNLTIGAEKAASITQAFQGHIAEIIVYPALLSSADIDEVSTWLLSTTGTISVTSPLSTDRRIVGLPEAITWSSANVSGTVDIRISLDNGSTFASLAAAEVNDGLYYWTPTTEQVASQVVIRVQQTSDNAVYDDSPAFRVATTTAGGGAGLEDTALWFRLQELAIGDGLELSRP